MKAKEKEINNELEEFLKNNPNINFMQTPNWAEIKENALHLLETFAMEDKKDEIFARLDAIKDKELGQKEMLMEAFKIIGGDENLLASTIDEILMQSEEVKRGKAV